MVAEPPLPPHHAATAGFTLIDLMMVVVILGIVTAVAVRVGSTDELRADATARAIAADLHEVQTLAIETRLPLGILYDAGRNLSALTLENGTVVRGNETALRAKAGLGADDAERILAVRTSGSYTFAPCNLTDVDFGGGDVIVFEIDGSPRSDGYVEVAAGNVRLRVRVQTTTGRITITAP